MSKIFVNVSIDETVKVQSDKGALSHLLYIGKGLALSLPLDAQKRKDTLFWLATQIEQEARKL